VSNNKNKNSMKMVYVILDGIGDLPHQSIDNRTPLEAAITPNLDKIAKNGSMGQVITVGKGIAPQSDIAVFNMLGYDFKDTPYVGRGVVESIGCGLEFNDGDLALRGNFATINDDLKIVDRRAGRIIEDEEARSICETLNKKIVLHDPDASVVLIPTIAHRVTIRFKHNRINLSEHITNTDPAYDKIGGIGIAKTKITHMNVLKSEPQNNTEPSIITAAIVNDFTKQVIALTKNHPVNISRIERGINPMNCILVRDAGNKVPSYIPIKKKYDLDIACVVDMPVELGISKILEMDVIRAGNVNDYTTKAENTIQKLANYDIIYVHIKGPDEFGHDGDAIGKQNNIEKIDTQFFGTLIDGLGTDDTIIIVSGDHSTPCIKKSHSDDPVPLLISGNKIHKDGSKRFTEKYAKEGHIGTIMGAKVLTTAIKMAN
jgi:2,3-bisphosphoglycerate-independent phosphoglycerate mutase